MHLSVVIRIQYTSIIGFKLYQKKEKKKEKEKNPNITPKKFYFWEVILWYSQNTENGAHSSHIHGVVYLLNLWCVLS